MAEYQQKYPQRPAEGIRSPTTSQFLAVLTLLPMGGTLLFLAAATLVGTLIGLAVSTPVFLIFSPVLVPAALVLGLGVVGFLASQAFGVTGLTSLSCMATYFRQMPQQIEQAKLKAQEAGGQVGQKAREAGPAVQGRAQEVTGKEGSRT